MLPWVELGRADVRGEREPLVLMQRGEEFVIRLGTNALMSSAAARTRVKRREDPAVLSDMGVGCEGSANATARENARCEDLGECMRAHPVCGIP